MEKSNVSNGISISTANCTVTSNYLKKRKKIYIHTLDQIWEKLNFKIPNSLSLVGSVKEISGFKYEELNDVINQNKKQNYKNHTLNPTSIFVYMESMLQNGIQTNEKKFQRVVPL